MKTYIANNTHYQFDFEAFNRAVSNYKDAHHLTFGAIEQKIADAVFVSADTVHKWRMKKNQPKDLDAIKSIATVLEMSDYTPLLIKIRPEEKPLPIDETESNNLRKSLYKHIFENMVSTNKEATKNSFKDLIINYMMKHQGPK